MMLFPNHPHATRSLRLATLVAAACSTLALPTTAGLHGRRVTLEAGTVIVAQLDDKLSSNESRKGDDFTATILGKSSKGLSDTSGLPIGTKVEGVVRNAQPKKDKDPGVLDLSFNRVELPDGQSYSVNGSLIGLDNKSVEKSSSGRLVAKKAHRTDRLTYVGIGAGAGAIVGLLGKHKRPLEDAAIGAGLGYLYGALDKSKSARDVALKEGTQLGVRLDSRLSYNTMGSSRH